MIIVTRHPGLVDWLNRRGITGTVIEHATPADVRGQCVIGNLPLSLAVLTQTIRTVEMPGLRADQRGKDITADEMNEAGAHLRTFRVVEILE